MTKQTILTEAQSAKLNELIRKAETGEDWAEICRLEAEMHGGPWFGAAGHQPVSAIEYYVPPDDEPEPRP